MDPLSTPPAPSLFLSPLCPPPGRSKREHNSLFLLVYAHHRDEGREDTIRSQAWEIENWKTHRSAILVKAHHSQGDTVKTGHSIARLTTANPRRYRSTRTLHLQYSEPFFPLPLPSITAHLFLHLVHHRTTVRKETTSNAEETDCEKLTQPIGFMSILNNN